MEHFDVVDEHGTPTGETVSRECAHREGILHRTAHVWVTREGEHGTEVLLQLRSPQKDSFPNMYDTSSAGHIPAGDEPKTSALRELEEELGIVAAPHDLDFIGTFRIQYEEEFHGQAFRDNEVAHVYVYDKPVDEGALVLQASEVSGVRWFALNDVWQEVMAGSSRFCVPVGGLRLLMDMDAFKREFRRVLEEIEEFTSYCPKGQANMVEYLYTARCVANSYDRIMASATADEAMGEIDYLRHNLKQNPRYLDFHDDFL